MLCPLCNGRRLFFFQGQLIPCPECDGQGEIHCCDGLQEQTSESATQTADSGAGRIPRRRRGIPDTMTNDKKTKKPLEFVLVGDVDDWERDVIREILDAKPRRDCVFYIDSMGGSVYGALAVTTLMRRRDLQCTGVVLGECSSASLLIFAACQKRLVTRYSTLLFHRMRWQSDKRVEAPRGDALVKALREHGKRDG